MSAKSIPWARWPWQQCRSVSDHDERCDLRRGHLHQPGPTIHHLAERGVGGWVRWSIGSWVEEPGTAAEDEETQS